MVMRVSSPVDICPQPDDAQGWKVCFCLSGTLNWVNGESEWPPPSGSHSCALHRRRSTRLHSEQWQQSLHCHQPYPTAQALLPVFPHWRPVCLALCFGETRPWEWLQPHRWAELRSGKQGFKSSPGAASADDFISGEMRSDSRVLQVSNCRVLAVHVKLSALTETWWFNIW